MQGLSGGTGSCLRHTDVDTRHAVRRSANRVERALVTQELDDRAGVVDEREPVRIAILNWGNRKRKGTQIRGFIIDGAGQILGVINGAVVAVVEHELPARQVGAGDARHLDKLTGVVTVVVVVNLVDPHTARRGESQVGVGVVDEHALGRIDGQRRIFVGLVAGVGRRDRVVVHSCDRDRDGRRIGQAAAVAHGVIEGIRGRLARAEVFELPVGIVLVTAVGIECEQGPRGERDFLAHVRGAVDQGDRFRVAVVDVRIVRQNSVRRDNQRRVLIGCARIVDRVRRFVDIVDRDEEGSC